MFVCLIARVVFMELNLVAKIELDITGFVTSPFISGVLTEEQD